MDLLERARARGAAFASTTVHGSHWGLRFEPSRLAVHVMLAGEAVLRTPDGMHVLGAGDIAAVRTTGIHSLAGGPASDLIDLPRFIDSPGVRRSEHVYMRDGDGPAATFLCGAYRFDGDLCSTLLDGLPEVVIMRATRGTAAGSVVDLVTLELADESPGKQTVLDRLLDVLLISVLRTHFGAAPTDAPSWYTALRDPAVRVALEAMHEDPAAQMTVESLAQLAHVSRATLAQRFADLVGVPPLTYLTSWRLQLAKERLRESDEPLRVIAGEAGYGSAYAFGAAFKRQTGQAPGLWRTREQASNHPRINGNPETG